MVKRAEIWLADMGDNRGSEPSFTRPVLVVQANAINRSSWKTIAVIAITSNLNYADIPGNVYLDKADGFLDRHSVVVCANLAAIDRSRFINKLADVSDLIMNQVEFGISIALDLK